jgi:hypothetical protein
MIGHLPDDLKLHGEKLEDFRELLVDSYQSVESKLDITKAFDEVIHAELKTALGVLRDDQSSRVVSVRRVSGVKKRTLLEDDCDNAEEVESAEASHSTEKQRHLSTRTSNLPTPGGFHEGSASRPSP